MSGGVLRQVKSSAPAQASVLVWNVLTDGNLIGDDIAFDSAALIAADTIAFAAGISLYFPKPSGKYKISGNITLYANCIFDEGAIIHQTSGSLTINGDIRAWISQIFKLESGVTFSLNRNKTLVGYAEWFGAIPGDTGTNCAPAINLALLALPKVQLMPAIYYTTETVHHETYGCEFCGMSNGLDAGPTGISQVRCQSASATIIEMFAVAIMHDITAIRHVAPQISSNCIGIDVIASGGEIYRCHSHDSMKGWKFNANGWLHCERLRSSRSIAGTGGGTDYWYGYHFDGITSTYYQGNASLYFEHSMARVVAFDGESITFAGLSTAYYCNGRFLDLFFNKIECEMVTYGLDIVGEGSSNVSEYGSLDFHCVHPVLEASRVPIRIRNTNVVGNLTFTEGYLLPIGAGYQAVDIDGCNVPITFTAMQYIMVSSNSDALKVYNSSMVRSLGGQIVNCDSHPVILNNSNSCEFTDTCLQRGKSMTNISLTNSNRNKFAMLLSGTSTGGAYVVADAVSDYNEFNCSGLDPATISGGAANKLVINGTQVTVAGISGAGAGHNVASGVMA